MYARIVGLLLMAYSLAPFFVTGLPIQNATNTTLDIWHPVLVNVTEQQWNNLTGIYNDLPGQQEMMEIVGSAIKRGRAMDCKPLKEKVICNRIQEFTRNEARLNETWDKVLKRLVSYLVFKQSLPEKADDAAFATVLDTIRGGNEIIAAPGALVGDNARILDALDAILDDICDGTWRSKVDSRLQEMVDIMEAGLRATMPPPYELKPTPPPCHCIVNHINGSVCIREASINWNDKEEDWDCNCLMVLCVAVPYKPPPQNPPETDEHRLEA
ncbi:hypothetical protein F4804DRAFT_334110 [Jackrogersella minutella]|nr:hypothetical protein F4804DRAFT_334110 [Jackrogersella minutella]